MKNIILKLFKNLGKKNDYGQLLKEIEYKYENKRGLWITTDKYMFRFDFENMSIEVVLKHNNDINNNV